MRFSFVLSILGQEFALASAPADDGAVEEVQSVASDLAFGFAATEADEWEEEE